MPKLPLGLAPFDENRAKLATPIWLVPQKEAESFIETQIPSASKVAKLAKFRGSLGQVVPFEEGVLVGIGDGDDPFALGAAADRLPSGDYVLANPEIGDTELLSSIGWGLGAYRFEAYKSQPAAPTLIIGTSIDPVRVANEVAGVHLVRDLVNTPAEDMGPDALEAAIREVAAEFDAEVNTVSGADVEDGFPLVHAVGRAADIAPRVVELRWGPKDGRTVTLVGKGVCFDSGGLDIKNATGMALMKKDMGGAANALGLARMIMSAGLDINLRLIIPAVENAISGNAFRPGDVFKARNGTTVEISNTDAEGRLILADALAWAAEENPSRIISLATLTGAARVALGPDLAPIYSTDADFAEAVQKIGDRVGDPVWPMPLWKRYDDYLSSSIADVNHAAATGFAGSITAALFLNRFVPETIPYTHFDIFAWTPKARPGRPQGGEAMAIRALFHTLAR